MVLQVLAHAWQGVDHLDPVLTQQVRLADARQFHDLRAADGARRQDQFAVDGHARRFALAPEGQARHPLAVEFDPVGFGMGHDSQVLAHACRLQESLCCVPAQAATLVHVEIAGAVVIAAVEIVGLGNAFLRGGLLEGV